MAAPSRQKQQYIVFGLGVGAVLALGIVIFGVLAPKSPAALAMRNSNDGIDVSIVADRTSAAAPEMSWVTSSRVEIDRLSILVDDLTKSIDAGREQTADQIAAMRQEYDDMILQQADRIAELETTEPRSAPTLSTTSRERGATGGISTPDYASFGQEFISREPVRRDASADFVAQQTGSGTTPSSQGSEPARELVSFGQSFTLEKRAGEAEGDAPNRLGNYIPAGSYAPAVVLSGADAATNVVDRENPTPVLFRVTGPAITAGRTDGPAGRINIDGCTVQGSAIGDLSSERVKVRLLSLTCLKRGGEVIEQKIAGYMVGAGKAGVRGRVVSREGPLVTNAAIAGALSGLANAAEMGGASGSDATSIEDIARTAGIAAGTGGVQSAANTLSEYYINRAEQYQPVISLNGGTKVELVFMEGISLQ
ncbi:MAG: TrbI/VirB10 family protein [Paracoccaceae bacterium]|nr:TrbI/VirB10 family protein [Paracoccaceae bacterium]MDG1736565.1 TrbI/VirB10 family protein [Paracoccaceae bacterium]MDG2260628.1 TrbI/VirB10 family protein [Paracoccaceae bacterium]